MRAFRFAVFSILLVMVFVTAAFLPNVSVLAQDSRGTATPTPLSPHGTILDKTPSYRWTKVTGASVYQYQVWRGDTKVIDKSPDSGACGATTCERTPTTSLGFNAYKWRVRAQKSGTWSAWSDFMKFSVSPPSFKSSFDVNMNNWTRKAGGTWSLSSGKYMYTSGQAGKYTSAVNTLGQYSDFDYTVRFYRYGDDPTFLMVRMGSQIGAYQYAWCPGYWFGITNAGKFGIFECDSDGRMTTIQDWISTTLIESGFNILRVEVKENKFWFYINGVGVKYFTDSSRTRGSIGIMAYRSAGTTSYNLYVDYAFLEVNETPQ